MNLMPATRSDKVGSRSLFITVSFFFQQHSVCVWELRTPIIEGISCSVGSVAVFRTSKCITHFQWKVGLDYRQASLVAFYYRAALLGHQQNGACQCKQGCLWKRPFLAGSICCSKTCLYLLALMLPSQMCKLSMLKALKHLRTSQMLSFELCAGNNLDDPFPC